MNTPGTPRPEDVVMTFGKHKGMTLGDILVENPSYLDWLTGVLTNPSPLKDAVTAMCERYAAEIERALRSTP